MCDYSFKLQPFSNFLYMLFSTKKISPFNNTYFDSLLQVESFP